MAGIPEASGEKGRGEHIGQVPIDVRSPKKWSNAANLGARLRCRTTTHASKKGSGEGSAEVPHCLRRKLVPFGNELISCCLSDESQRSRILRSSSLPR